MEKTGKGKVVAIIILIVMVLGLGGYLGYHILVEDIKVEDNNKKEIEKLNKKIEEKSVEEKNIKLTGFYKYTYADDDEVNSGGCILLGLFEDNTAVLSNLSVGLARLFGGYEVKDNKIIFNYKWVDGEQRQPSYEGLKNFTFKNNKTLILEEGFGEKNIELKKITKDEYYNTLKKGTIPISTTVTD